MEVGTWVSDALAVAVAVLCVGDTNEGVGVAVWEGGLRVGVRVVVWEQEGEAVGETVSNGVGGEAERLREGVGGLGL